MSYDPYPPSNSPNRAAPQRKNSAGAGWPLGLGIFGMIGWILPIVGLPVTITGLVLGIKAMSGRSKGMAIAAVVLCSIGLAMSVLNMGLGIYLAATGQHPLVNQMKAQ